MRVSGMALTKVKYLVTLPLPTLSLFMCICCHETACLEHINFFQHHVILLQCETMVRKYQMIWDYSNKCFDWAVQHAIKAEIPSPTFQLMQRSHLRRWQVPPRSCTFLLSWPQTLSGSLHSNKLKAASGGFDPSGTVTGCKEERNSGETL